MILASFWFNQIAIHMYLFLAVVIWSTSVAIQVASTAREPSVSRTGGPTADNGVTGRGEMERRGWDRGSKYRHGNVNVMRSNHDLTFLEVIRLANEWYREWNIMIQSAIYGISYDLRGKYHRNRHLRWGPQDIEKFIQKMADFFLVDILKVNGVDWPTAKSCTYISRGKPTA